MASLGGLFSKFTKTAAVCPSVTGRDALRGDDRSCRGDDNSALDFTPYAKRLALAFFFFARDERDHVVNHFGPLGEILPCSGDCLIGSCDDFADTVFEQWSQHRHIALDRAVGLYGDESAARAETGGAVPR